VSLSVSVLFVSLIETVYLMETLSKYKPPNQYQAWWCGFTGNLKYMFRLNRLLLKAARCGSGLEPGNVNSHPWSLSLGKDFQTKPQIRSLDENILSFFVQTFIQFSESTVQVGIIHHSVCFVTEFYAARQTIKEKWGGVPEWLYWGYERREQNWFCYKKEWERFLECFWWRGFENWKHGNLNKNYLWWNNNNFTIMLFYHFFSRPEHIWQLLQRIKIKQSPLIYNTWISVLFESLIKESYSIANNAWFWLRKAKLFYKIMKKVSE